MKKQENVTDNMGDYTESLMEEGKQKDNDKGIEVSEFLNQPSPQKKSNKRTFEDMRGDTSLIAFDDDDNDDDEGLAVKLERINEVTGNGNVSLRLSKRVKKK